MRTAVSSRGRPRRGAERAFPGEPPRSSGSACQRPLPPFPPARSITDTAEAFALTLLSTLLVSGPSAPFYKALIESGLGSDFSPDVG